MKSAHEVIAGLNTALAHAKQAETVAREAGVYIIGARAKELAASISYEIGKRQRAEDIRQQTEGRS